MAFEAQLLSSLPVGPKLYTSNSWRGGGKSDISDYHSQSKGGLHVDQEGSSCIFYLEQWRSANKNYTTKEWIRPDETNV